MWRSERTLDGPIVATVADIEALNRMFSEAFTERYRRDGLSGVRVPYLNPQVWQFAIADAGAGAMTWRDGRGELVAFNMVHRSGSEGWMGPLAVRTDRQGHGLGRRVVAEGVAWLAAQQVATIGLETMPRTIDNIGFYSRLGFVPERLTVTLQRDRPRRGTAGIDLLSEHEPAEQQRLIAACAALTDRVVPGIDFTREVELTLAGGLGDVNLLYDDGALTGFALWHAVPLALGRNREELRVLKLVARDDATAERVVAQVEHAAAAQGLGRLAVRCQTRHDRLYTALIGDGFRVQWTDLRMTLAGRPQADRRGVLLSNWEI